MANFSSYNKTYGSLAGVIIFLVWLWISNIAILLGLEFNPELERAGPSTAATRRRTSPTSNPATPANSDAGAARDGPVRASLDQRA